jgi:hypothetical protein
MGDGRLLMIKQQAAGVCISLLVKAKAMNYGNFAAIASCSFKAFCKSLLKLILWRRLH